MSPDKSNKSKSSRATPAALNPVGRPKSADVATLPALRTEQLDAVRALAQEGVREVTMRRALGLTVPQWKALRADHPDGDPSPLSLALAEGIAAGQADIIGFMKRRMVNDNSETAAMWLAERVFKLGKTEGDEAAPRVSIVINAAMSPTDYARMIEVTQG
jgi:hypothetical protein